MDSYVHFCGCGCGILAVATPTNRFVRAQHYTSINIIHVYIRTVGIS